MDSIEERISRLSGFNTVKVFFESTEIRNLSDKELRLLLVKIATLDSLVQLSALVTVVKSELDSRDAHRNFKITTTIAVIALLLSVIGLLVKK